MSSHSRAIEFLSLSLVFVMNFPFILDKQLRQSQAQASRSIVWFQFVLLWLWLHRDCRVELACWKMTDTWSRVWGQARSANKSLISRPVSKSSRHHQSPVNSVLTTDTKAINFYCCLPLNSMSVARVNRYNIKQNHIKLHPQQAGLWAPAVASVSILQQPYRSDYADYKNSMNGHIPMAFVSPRPLFLRMCINRFIMHVIQHWHVYRYDIRDLILQRKSYTHTHIHTYLHVWNTLVFSPFPKNAYKNVSFTCAHVFYNFA